MIGVHPLSEAIYYHPYNEEYLNNDDHSSNYRNRNSSNEEQNKAMNGLFKEEIEEWNDDDDDEMIEKCTIQSIDSNTKNTSVITYLGEGTSFINPTIFS